MSQPNILVVMCDQLRPFELGCYGGPVPTPHIDALANQGTRFQCAVTNNPLCLPARTIFQSGQYCRSSGLDNTNEVDGSPFWHSGPRRYLPNPTLAECLRNAGYRTGIVGDWHSYYDPVAMGFDYAQYRAGGSWYTDQVWIRNRQTPRVEPGHQNERLPRFFAEFLEESGANPFFAWITPTTPHMPHVPVLPGENAPRFRREDVVLRGNVPNPPPDDASWFKIYLYENYMVHKLGNPGFRETDFPLPPGFDLVELARLYYGSVAYTDELVGRLLSVLRQSGREQDTLVLFLSDHGENLGSHGLFNKDHLNEEAIRIPFLARWPGRIPCRVESEHIAQTLDILPTLLEAAGVPVPPTVQGRSFLSTLEGGAPSCREAFIETPYRAMGVRTPTHLYGCRGENRYLFNLEADPLELYNLVGQGLPVETHLAERLAAFDAQTPWLCR